MLPESLVAMNEVRIPEAGMTRVSAHATHPFREQERPLERVCDRLVLRPRDIVPLHKRHARIASANIHPDDNM